MRRGRPRVASWLVAASAVAAVAATGVSAQQVPGDPRERYPTRQRSTDDRPQTQQKFEESLHKLEADDLPTKLEGIEELGKAEHEPRALAYLLGAANDPDMSIRAKAIETLGQMKSKDATVPLVQRLFLKDTDAFTRRRILAALGQIGDPRATDPLITFIGGTSDEEARAGAVFALGEIGNPEAIPTLQKIVDGDPTSPVKPVAQMAIDKIHSRPVPTEVPPALAGDDRGQPPPR